MPLAASSGLRITGSNLTQSAWINPASNVMNGVIATRAGWYFFQRSTNLMIAAYQFGTVPAGYHYSTGTVPLDGWTHVAIAYDGNTLRFYINGLESGTIEKTGSISYASLTYTNAPFRIGWDATVGARYWNGLLDEVRVSNVTRSSNWIWACYMNQASNNVFTSKMVILGGTLFLVF